MKARIELLVCAVIAGFTLTACDGGSSLPGLIGADTGQLVIELTDAPFPFFEVKRVDVFVVRIDAKAGESDDAEVEDASQMSGWTTLVSPNALVNLVDFSNGKTVALGTATVPVGTYRSFRMVIATDHSSITLNDDSKPDVKWPSVGNNGIRVKLDQPVVISGTSNLLIDFDLGRSFVMRGNSISKNGLLFKPIVRGTAQQSTGTVSGSVHADTPTGAPIAGATVEVLKDGTPLSDTDASNIVRSGMTDATGNFTLRYLPPGTYVVRATPIPASGYKPALLTGGVTITAATVTGGKVIVVTK
jgi:hypothetical protein